MFKVQVYPACLLEFLDPLLAAQEVDALVVQAALARVNALVTRVLLLAARAVDALVVRADGSPLARVDALVTRMVPDFTGSLGPLAVFGRFAGC